MNQLDRLLIGTLATGIWALVALQVNLINSTNAQETAIVEQQQEDEYTRFDSGVVNATEVVGLRALIEKVIRESQLKPYSISGLDQHIKSIMRGCKVSGGVTGDRISYANISC